LKVSDLPISTFLRELGTTGVWIRTGPFLSHLQTSFSSVGRTIHLLYADFPIVAHGQFADFHLRIAPPRTLRRWIRQQALFHLDDEVPFKPLPASQAFAMFEWSLNWCIETYAHQFLIIHAAVIERKGQAAILAAPPSSGKSTLTAALIHRGWRLLSDELTLIDPANGMAIPIARPVGLKNQSIEVIREFEPNAVIGPVVVDTLKGTVAHVKPPGESVRRVDEAVMARWVIFPKFEAGGSVRIRSYPKGTSLLRLADNAFNYSHYGLRGFELMSELIENCDCYEFSYGRLDDAIQTFDSLK